MKRDPDLTFPPSKIELAFDRWFPRFIFAALLALIFLIVTGRA